MIYTPPSFRKVDQLGQKLYQVFIFVILQRVLFSPFNLLIIMSLLIKMLIFFKSIH
jgi:hypothetical protein